MWHTVFVLAGPGRPGEALPRITQLRLDTARALCERHAAIQRVVFVGGAASRPGGLSLSEHMKRVFERDMASFGRALELVVLAESNTTAGNVREMCAAAPGFVLDRTLPVISRRAHFLRIARHARRSGFRVEPLTIEDVLGAEVMPRVGLGEVVWTIRRSAVWAWELVDPEERVPALIVGLVRRLTWRATQ